MGKGIFINDISEQYIHYLTISVLLQTLYQVLPLYHVKS